MVPAGRSASLTPGALILVSPVVIGEFHDRIGIGDVEILADQHHAERRIQPAEEDAARLGDAVAVGVAQQRDAVGARHPGARPFLRLPVDKALDALAVVRLRRRVALGDQHVAVGQHIDRARMIEPGREGRDRHAVGGDRLGAVGPAADRGDIDRRDPRMFRRRQGGRRTVALRHGRGRLPGVVAGGKRQRQCGDACCEEDVVAHGGIP